MREVRPLAGAVERDGRETSTPGLAPLRIAQARRSYHNAGTEASAVLLRRAVPPAELHPWPAVLLLGRTPGPGTERCGISKASG